MAITTLEWQLHQLDRQLIDIAFAEDLGLPYKDVTTSTLFSERDGYHGLASIISKNPQPIIICGLPLIQHLLQKLSGHCELQSEYQDGDTVLPGSTLLTVTGPLPVLLSAERIVLNFLQHLSAIATLTNRFVNEVKQTKVKILDTRKTLPGFRHLGKYAVHCGGGVNHRMGLYDAVMIKDTHIDSLGGMRNALARLPKNMSQTLPVIVEVRSKNELEIVLETGQHKISRVLLDNMSTQLIRECVLMCETLLPTEVSGNINLDNVLAVAETGVDFISVGKLTHSAGNVDLSMKCKIKHA